MGGQLPIDPLLPEIAALYRRGARAVVIEAPPGAGKTTRVPRALFESLDAGEVWVLEPRRLAAHLSAARVAEERGEVLGDVVGVQMRFDSVCGPRTRLRFVTEGVLTRRLLQEGDLPGVAVVVLDEFHERHLQGDLALALLKRLQAGPRPDLRLCVMSATLDAGAVARYLDDCPVVRSEGRSHEVAISYLPQPLDRPLSREIRGAVLNLLREAHAAPDDATLQGDVLVFLPGAGEIRRAAADLAEVAAERGLDVLPLHGDLPLSEQRRAVLPRAAGRRKLILATNVAETSITIDGVTVVIDSGLARQAGHSPWSGLPTLRVGRVARAAATQRAGRAGRTQPGRCLRLYTRHDHDTRPAYDTPEIRRADLCETVLLLRAGGVDPAALQWLDAPAAQALLGAEALLGRLGALSLGRVTPLGARMAGIPLHPRQARVLLAAAERGLWDDGCALAALLGERDLRLSQRALSAGRTGRGASHSGPSDVLALLEIFEAARRERFAEGRLQAQGVDPYAAQTVERVRRRLSQSPAGRGLGGRATPMSEEARERALLQALLYGYPDRVARRRVRAAATPGSGPGSVELLLAGGGTAGLDEGSVVRDAELVVAIDAEERGAAPGTASGAQVQRASAIEADWLLDLPGEGLAETTELSWSAAGRVEAVRRLRYEALVLTESRGPARADEPGAAEVLLAAARAAGLSEFTDAEGLLRLRARLAFVAELCPDAGVTPLDEPALDALLAELCEGQVSFAGVRAAAAGLEGQILTRCVPGGGRRLLALAPESVTLPGGRRARVEYAAGQPPWIASRLQDFFGMSQGPRVGEGRVALVLHLLAPSGRPVQVTTDLAGFWIRHYPALRRELGRRYPRHAWPEDPLAASPPTPGSGRHP